MVNNNNAESTNGSHQVPMLRGVPQRRTFDSGYGEGQSCVSSPIAEPKKNNNNNSNSYISASSANTSASLSGQRMRARLRRQKAIDRASCPSSAHSSRSRPLSSSYHSHAPHPANSSTDYEDNDDYDDYDNLYSRRSSSVGKIHEFTRHVYGRMRRKTSSTTSSSDNDDEDIDDDGCNTSSGNEQDYNIAIIKRKLKASLPQNTRRSAMERRPHSGKSSYHHHHRHNHHLNTTSINIINDNVDELSPKVFT